ncbi:penicillin binding protein PBP4B [Treponema sp. OMZ 803]|uniref:penicillin binding protein PBP4B n=1 Tax=Treponema sp. OMZ 803 TaxID=120682 RepID=UPI0020A3D0A1|nr:penicillin binding protein PBP4B [Treponema sp. OMZ 803]UTC53100.1 penicillin binding protein PBP4B [Treponema sp. OMZ 803]
MKPSRFSLRLFLWPFAVSVVISYFLLSLLGCASASARKHDSVLPTDDAGMIEAVFSADTQMQAEQTFPIPMKEYDDSILPNNYLAFTAYKGQAYIYFWAQGLASFDLYINNQKVPTQSICTGKPMCFDASPYIQNGRNMLYIAALTPAGNGMAQEQPSLQVKIPYPVILPLSNSQEALKKQQKDAPYSAETLEIVDQLLTAETEAGFPGAQLVIIKDGKMIKNSAYGAISRVDSAGNTLDEVIPVTEKTLFDLASNTKMYAVNFAIQKLISERRLALTDTVHHFFPQFVDAKKSKIKGKADITIFDLLTHQSGLPVGRAYSQKIKKLKNVSEKSYREHTFDLIMETPLVYLPRQTVLYSDINYMLLTYIIEKVTGIGVAEYVADNFYRPLGLDRICFTPLRQGFTLDEIAATEIRAKPRTQAAIDGAQTTELIHGTVHDSEAYTAMEEISGHAGLFANAESIAVLAQVMLNKGGYGVKRFFDPSVAGYFTAQQALVSSIGFGWRRQGAQEYTWAFSPLASAGTFGHTGWTGTLTIIDPVEHLIIILLTNAKNTVPAHNTRNSRFEGDYYLAKQYGAITALIYEAFRQPTQAQLESMLIELAEKKYEMLQQISAFNNQGYINDLAAIMKIVKQRAQKSAGLRKFLKTETAAQILKVVDGRI